MVQPVKDAAPWPENQRFDYVVQRRELETDEILTIHEKFKNQSNEYHAAVELTLSKLTGIPVHVDNPIETAHDYWVNAIEVRKVNGG